MEKANFKGVRAQIKFSSNEERISHCRGCRTYEFEDLLCNIKYNKDGSCPCTNCIVKMICTYPSQVVGQCKIFEKWFLNKSRRLEYE